MDTTYYRIDKSGDFPVASPSILIHSGEADEMNCIAIVTKNQQHRQCKRKRAKVDERRMKITDVTDLTLQLKSAGLLCGQHQTTFNKRGTFQIACLLEDEVSPSQLQQEQITVPTHSESAKPRASEAQPGISDEEVDRFIAEDPGFAAYVSARLKQGQQSSSEGNHGVSKEGALPPEVQETARHGTPLPSTPQITRKSGRYFSPPSQGTSAAYERHDALPGSGAVQSSATPRNQSSQSASQHPQHLSFRTMHTTRTFAEARGADLGPEIRPLNLSRQRISCRRPHADEPMSEERKAVQKSLEEKLQELDQSIIIAIDTIENMKIVYLEVQGIYQNHFKEDSCDEDDDARSAVDDTETF